jgi:phosphoglycerol transferase MdoB-like AlkP superfamily enzyme
MNNKATTSQVFKSGLSFLSVSLAIGLISLVFYLMAINSNNFGSAIVFIAIGSLFSLVGIIGLISKFMTDGITMGLENGKPDSNMSNINPMGVAETLQAGFNLFGMICLIVLATFSMWFIGMTSSSIDGFLFFSTIAAGVFLSGFLGLLVKIVGDSISHAITTSGYGALLHQVGVREVSVQKEEHHVESVSVSSELEWTDSAGHKWKKLSGQLYWWNGTGWKRHN